MSIQYRVYKNDGLGGPVDLSTIVVTTASLTYTSGTLATPSDTTFLVRAFDTVTGYEDQAVDARVRVVLDASGHDLSTFPSAPVGLSVSPRVGGTAIATWIYPPGLPGAKPTGFHVYLGTPTPSYGSPVATLGYDPTKPGKAYQATLAVLSDGVVYQV